MWVCLPLLHALAVSAPRAQPLTCPLLSVGEGTSSRPVCCTMGKSDKQKERTIKFTLGSHVSHAVIHAIDASQKYTIQPHAHRHTHTHILYITHLVSQEAMGPVGRSSLDRLVHLFTSNYRNRTIFCHRYSCFFIYTLTRETARAGETERTESEERKKNKKQSSDSPFSQW